MSVTTFLLLVALGIVVGAFGTLIGVGGGVIVTPVLLVVYPQYSPQTITAMSLAVVFCNAVSGSSAYARMKRIDYRSGLLFAAAALPGSVAGALLIQFVPTQPFDVCMAILLLLVVAWLEFGKPQLTSRHGAHLLRRRVVIERDGVRHEYDVPVRLGVVASLGVGLVSSFLGIGGGIIHVPLMTQLLGFPIHVATATSHFVIAFMAGTATITHVAAGDFAASRVVIISAALAIGVIIGAQAGARISKRVSGLAIQRLLALALVILAVRLVISAL